MLKFVDMNTPQNAGAVSLKDSIIEVEGWTAALYQQNFMDFLEQQPYIMGSLMEAVEGMDDDTHSWMLKSVLLLKWSFQKMGWRLTMLSNEKWQGVIEEAAGISARVTTTRHPCYRQSSLRFDVVQWLQLRLVRWVR